MQSTTDTPRTHIYRSLLLIFAMSCTNCARLQDLVNSKSAYIAYLRDKLGVTPDVRDECPDAASGECAEADMSAGGVGNGKRRQGQKRATSATKELSPSDGDGVEESKQVEKKVKVSTLVKRLEMEMKQFDDPDYGTEFTHVEHPAADTVTVTDCFGNSWRVRRSLRFIEEAPTLWFHDEVVEIIPGSEWSPSFTSAKWLVAHIAVMQSNEGDDCSAAPQ